ncbi:terminase [Streptomyces platensis subsp. clarensis]|nr:terminase [Streptomyces platensis subsp. clarensis]
MPFKPEYPGEVPTLGWHVLDFISSMLAAPDKGEYEPLILTPEQAQFVLNWYALDPVTGRRQYRRGVLSRPKGWGKSPILSAIACAEALAGVVPDGWDSNGRPVGKPWLAVRTPLVQVAAVSEQQTANAWGPLLEMLRLGPALDHFDIEPLDSFVNLPRGRIMPVTSSASSAEGARAVFAIMDQTEEWKQGNGGKRFAEVIRKNAAKINGTTLESPNAYTPGEGSVAEESAAFYKNILEGRALDNGLLYDHREADSDTDLDDELSVMKGLAQAYGDSADVNGGWVDLKRLAAERLDPAMPPQIFRAYFLNQITHASDSWLSEPELKGVADPDTELEPGTSITLGFDGSRKRARGVADATALVGCRVSDGHLFSLGVWEQPDGPAGRNWEVPKSEVHAAVAEAFKTYNVVGFFADPAKWESDVGEWEAKYISKHLQIRASQAHPIEFWMNGGRAVTIVRATEKLHNAIIDREITYDGSHVLTRHFLNARRRPGQKGLQIAKDFPDSPRKIDAAVAAILAFEARSHAVAKGLTGRKRSRRVTRL